MQILFLDKNPAKAALYHYDKHVGKMLMELSQLLSTVMVDMGSDMPGLYKPVPQGKELQSWLKKSSCNFDWAVMMGYFLAAEWAHRYGGVHLSTSIIKICDINRPAAFEFELQKLTKPPLRFTSDYEPIIDFDSPVKSYRLYYAKHKNNLAKWTGREEPYWFNKYLTL